MVDPNTIGVIKPSPDLWPAPDRARVREALLTVPWRPADGRPGHFVRGPVTVNGVDFLSTITCCADCGEQWPATFMVHNHTWAEAAGRNESLCWPCFERRLGRDVREDDLTDCPVNRVYRHIMLGPEFRNG